MIKSYKKENLTSYTLGTTLTFELLINNPKIVTNVYTHSNLKKDTTYYKLLDLCKKNGISMSENDKVFNVLSKKENCFVIGEFKKYNMTIDKEKNHVVLVNPADAGNIGTIFRSCLGFGIENIAIVKPAVDIFNPKAVRSSMGALFSLNVQYFESFDEYYQKNKNHEMFTLMLQATTSLNLRPQTSKPFSIIFGNEATGLDTEFLRIGTPLIIKHSSKIDSLNLPIAVSVTLYEFTKNSF